MKLMIFIVLFNNPFLLLFVNVFLFLIFMVI